MITKSCWNICRALRLFYAFLKVIATFCILTKNKMFLTFQALYARVFLPATTQVGSERRVDLCPGRRRICRVRFISKCTRGSKLPSGQMVQFQAMIWKPYRNEAYNALTGSMRLVFKCSAIQMGIWIPVNFVPFSDAIWIPGRQLPGI